MILIKVPVLIWRGLAWLWLWFWRGFPGDVRAGIVAAVVASVLSYFWTWLWLPGEPPSVEIYTNTNGLAEPMTALMYEVEKDKDRAKFFFDPPDFQNVAVCE